MAILLGVHDPDPECQRLMAERLGRSPLIPAHLKARRFERGALRVHVWSPASTPLSSAARVDGQGERWAFVCGDGWPPRLGCAASRLLDALEGMADPSASLGGWSDYGLALVQEPRGLWLGTDALGYFPLYYWHAGETLLFGTSPELFRAHPRFEAHPSTPGLAALLLLSHACGRATLLSDVWRLPPARVLHWSPGRPPEERPAERLSPQDTGFSQSYSNNRERLHGLMQGYIDALGGYPALDLYLSGGQDSRMIAGYLSALRGRCDLRAVSLGNRAASELRYARAVSARLGIRHRHADVEMARVPDYAERQLGLESLAGPFVSFANGRAAELLAERDCPFLSGYLGDPVLGDQQIRSALDPATGLWQPERQIASMRRYGWEPEAVIELLADPRAREAVDSILESLRQDWLAIEGYDFQRAWLFALTHRVRFHVGSIIWRLSLGNWPILPYIHRPLLELVLGLPLDHLHERRLQADLIREHFPALARLPLDRNSARPAYLVKPLGVRLGEALPELERAGAALVRRLQRGQSAEHRYYVHSYDYNNSGWRLLRQRATAALGATRGILNAAALEQRRIGPAVEVRFSDPIVRTARYKTLDGLTLWLERLGA